MPTLSTFIIVTLLVGVLPSPTYQATCPPAHQPVTYSGKHTNWACQMTKHIERRVHSQYGQDGVLEYIFHHIGTTNKYVALLWLLAAFFCHVGLMHHHVLPDTNFATNMTCLHGAWCTVRLLATSYTIGLMR
jgi:hypothetical protein